jgi:DNA-binding transcriptional MerR regulator
MDADATSKGRGGDELLTHDEAAAYLRIPPKTLYLWNYRGLGPKRIRAGRRCLYRFKDLLAWVDAHVKEAS